MPFEIFPWVAMRRHKGERNIAEALRDIKDCNFTASCFIEAKDVALCREIGLDPIVYPFRSAKPDELHDSDFAIDTYFKSSDGRPSISPLVREKGATAEQIDAAVKDALTEMPEGKLKLYGSVWIHQLLAYKGRTDATILLQLLAQIFGKILHFRKGSDPRRNPFE